MRPEREAHRGPAFKGAVGWGRLGSCLENGVSSGAVLGLSQVTQIDRPVLPGRGRWRCHSVSWGQGHGPGAEIVGESTWQGRGAQRMV